MIFDYPWYFAVLCLLVGVAYGVALYWGQKARAQRPALWTWVLGVVRSVAVSAVALLLLAPVAKRQLHEKERPIVLVAEDHSKSVGADTLVDLSLGSDYEVVRVPFGGTTTDIAKAMSDLAERYEGRNVGAMVVVSDGIYNQGADPSAVAPGLGFPVYAVALGDTVRYADAAVWNVRCNRLAYMGSQFPMEVTVNAHGLEGRKSRLTVTSEGKTLYAKDLYYNDGDFSTTEALTLDAAKAGVHTYTVVLSPLEGERNVANNTMRVTVEVVDGHQRIALVGGAPHPDLSALKQALESNENYEVKTMLSGDLKGGDEAELKRYNLLVLHNLPNGSSPAWLVATGVPTLYVVGSGTDLTRLNALHAGVEVYTKLRKTNEVTPIAQNGFSAFVLERECVDVLEQMPPLVSPFGEYRMEGGTQMLFSARIGSVDSRQPLVAVGSRQGVRSAFVMGEGLWRWRLSDYQMNASHEHFDELVNKLVVYASVQVGKERFRATAKSLYRGDEAVMVEAELYNDNYEPVNTPDAHLKVNGEEYEFNRVGDGYKLRLGQLAPGEYRYKASTRLGSKSYESEGSFVVEEVDLEQRNTVADHTLLRTMCTLTGGAMLQKEDADRLGQILEERGDMKPIIYSRIRYSEMLNLPWLLVLLVLLLGMEWITRKYWGEL